VRAHLANHSGALQAEFCEIESGKRSEAELGKSRKPLTQNGLARMLKPLGIGPDKIGPETKRLNGYKRDWGAHSRGVGRNRLR